ncbi:MAG: hypothetical protein J5858_10170 [Lentisphaeria bacterium]|nr:hypothetical protein [Lentisphaeria bacterium]
MNSDKYSFELLTPTLCHGAFPKEEAELREPSIRGHLRRWHTLLWGEDDTAWCWGNAGKNSSASKVVLRLSRPEKEQTGQTSFLPHKKYGGTEVPALLPIQNKYTLNVSFRYLQNNTEDIPDRVRKTIRCWLLMGTVGQRSSRAFGSVWPSDDPPATPDALEKELLDLLADCDYAFRLSPRINGLPDMKLCTNTLQGASNEVFFGYVKGRERKTSPLKMKFVRLNGVYYLLLHAQKMETINGALRVLQQAGKPLGQLFAGTRK